jgi:hypothetical protein
MWRHDHPVVKDCLVPALQSVEIRHTRATAIAKQLRASTARVDAHNDVISIGDCVWLTVPEEVIKSVSTHLRLHDEQRHCVPKMLCKVVQVNRVEATTTVGAQVTFMLLSPDGILQGWYPIDEVARCSPPPEDEPVTSMTVPNAMPSRGKKSNRLKLPAAYRKYVQWLTVRTAARVLQSGLPGPSAPVSLNVNQQGSLPLLLNTPQSSVPTLRTYPFSCVNAPARLRRGRRARTVPAGLHYVSRPRGAPAGPSPWSCFCTAPPGARPRTILVPLRLAELVLQHGGRRYDNADPTRQPQRRRRSQMPAGYHRSHRHGRRPS